MNNLIIILLISTNLIIGISSDPEKKEKKISSDREKKEKRVSKRIKERQNYYGKYLSEYLTESKSNPLIYYNNDPVFFSELRKIYEPYAKLDTSKKKDKKISYAQKKEYSAIIQEGHDSCATPSSPSTSKGFCMPKKTYAQVASPLSKITLSEDSKDEQVLVSAKKSINIQNTDHYLVLRLTLPETGYFNTGKIYRHDSECISNYRKTFFGKELYEGRVEWSNVPKCYAIFVVRGLWVRRRDNTNFEELDPIEVDNGDEFSTFVRQSFSNVIDDLKELNFRFILNQRLRDIRPEISLDLPTKFIASFSTEFIENLKYFKNVFIQNLKTDDIGKYWPALILNDGQECSKERFWLHEYTKHGNAIFNYSNIINNREQYFYFIFYNVIMINLKLWKYERLQSLITPVQNFYDYKWKYEDFKKTLQSFFDNKDIFIRCYRKPYVDSLLIESINFCYDLNNVLTNCSITTNCINEDGTEAFIVFPLLNQPLSHSPSEMCDLNYATIKTV